MKSASEFCVNKDAPTLRLRKDAAKTEQASLPGFLALSAPREVALLPRVARTLSVVSMFSGCGGMDLGFLGGLEIFGRHYLRLPFAIMWANDLNEAACRTYQHNLGQHIHCGDVWDVIDTLPKAADVLIGGFPCQDISVNGKRQGVQGARSGLYKAMVEAIGRVKPKVFVAENVKGLLMKHSQDSLRQVLTDFQGLGYQVNYHLYRAADYGVP